MELATIINYCTNDYRFIKKCIDSVLPFSKQVIVPVADHFFDGTEEDKGLLEKTFFENAKSEFYLYNWKNIENPRYWHNISRLVGIEKLLPEIDFVLFLDSDEIVETELFEMFLNNNLDKDSYKIANYWYFREPIYRAKQIEDSAVLVKKEFININPYNKALEREQLCIYNNNQRFTTQNGKPMIHHFSWVRSKEEMLKKVKSWGHNLDKDWVSLIEEEFSRPFNGKCFVNNYDFEIVENKFDL